MKYKNISIFYTHMPRKEENNLQNNVHKYICNNLYHYHWKIIHNLCTEIIDKIFLIKYVNNYRTYNF